MKCGHVSNALYTEDDGAKIPVCSNCIKINPVDAKTVVDLTNRIALCNVCGNLEKSSPDLFDFFYTGKAQDTYYDGCLG